VLAGAALFVWALVFTLRYPSAQRRRIARLRLTGATISSPRR
jgi:hypothetical protein